MSSTPNIPGLSRRDVIRIAGVSLAAAPLLGACGASESSSTPDAGSSPDAGTAADAGVVADAGTAADAGTTITRAWATGGTAAMVAADSYPNPFATGLADETCDLTCALTIGPCYAPTAPVRQDVSEGISGIPLRLALRLVEADSECTPVAGAELEIWHCDVRGFYSASDANEVEFCTGNDEQALASYYGRGRAITDSNGVAYFDTVFPGWYHGRAIHIHFVVRRSEYVGGVQDTNASVVSQLFFPEDLTAQIFSGVDGYIDRGQPDTTNTSDSVLGSTDVDPYLVGFAQMTDGAMLAWKTIAISDDESCGGGGGGGGPPGGGGMGPPPDGSIGPPPDGGVELDGG